jgi:hypothetical protein
MRTLALLLLVAGAARCPADPASPQGQWGGPHAGMVVTPADAALEFDCAAGRIGTAFRLDGAGRFDLPGDYTAGTGGPVRDGEEPQPQPARYRGGIRGDRMELEILIAATGQRIGPYTLRKGRAPQIFACL